MSYYYSPFLTFFFVFFFFLLILIILTPNYLKREIATPLGASNYAVKGGDGVINVGDFETVSFKDMQISDEDPAISAVAVSFIPDFSIMSERLVGFFHLKVTSTTACELVFRSVDQNGTTVGNTIKDYNKGWSAVSINTPGTIKPLYNVYVPFDIPSLSNKNTSHEITVQIAATSNNGSRTSNIGVDVVELNSADVYFLPY
jgi:hypothetical protein